ncbi:Hypothetical predicted protein [Olea europaea subsp. europaea]|uniref:Uncharacterized protein n=1 Tax=Olea europaea subsp. europaea TaxID=158383 RepID=A0A8S0RPE4_OLEEU|nr:Hypothetical predicted protein [Olea europaea subsp. europaea]
MAVIVWARAIGRSGPRPWRRRSHQNWMKKAAFRGVAQADRRSAISIDWMAYRMNCDHVWDCLDVGYWPAVMEVVEGSEVSLLAVGSGGQGGRKVVGGAGVVVKWREKWREMNEKGSDEIDLGN